MIASAVVTPSGMETSVAAAMTQPSTNVWTASPTINSVAVLLCT